MALYVLTDLFKRDVIVSKFKSLIWTERFAEIGDFELEIQSTPDNRKLLAAEKYLAMDNSTRVMKIETVQDTIDEEGRTMLKLTGRSLEFLLESRVGYKGIDSIDSIPKWTFNATPGDIAREIFNSICVLGTLDVDDKIPHIHTTSIYPPDNVIEPSEPITLEFDPSSVYSMIKAICDAYDIGFRLVNQVNTQELYFNIYTGNDRTSAQTTFNPVIFSQSLDNLSKVTEINSVQTYKNIAYVFSAGKSMIVPSVESTKEPTGLNRHVLVVNVTDIPEFEGTESEIAQQVDNFLFRRGQEELAQHRRLQAFDGEIPQNGKYKYEVDYRLGDLVEMQNVDGFAKNMRVSEQIFVFDEEGERSYPTLTDYLFINPGTWFSWDYNAFWENAEGTWEEADPYYEP